MSSIRFSCTRCGACCRSSIPLGLGEALDYDQEFILSLVFGVETWNIDAFGKNKPQIPISLEQLLTTLAFRKDKLALEPSRPVVFQVGRLRATGERLVTFVTVGAAAVGDWQDGRARCHALGADNLCTIYQRRPQVCRAFPLDPLFPEMLADAPLDGLAGRMPCGFAPDAPLLWDAGKLADPYALAALTARQETIRQDSLFLPFWGRHASAFAPLPSLSDIIIECVKSARMDLPFFPALAYLCAAGHISVARAELCLDRQAGLVQAGLDKALQTKDKSQRNRTRILRNTLTLMQTARGAFSTLAETLAGMAPEAQAEQAGKAPGAAEARLLAD